MAKKQVFQAIYPHFRPISRDSRRWGPKMAKKRYFPLKKFTYAIFWRKNQKVNNPAHRSFYIHLRQLRARFSDFFDHWPILYKFLKIGYTPEIDDFLSTEELQTPKKSQNIDFFGHMDVYTSKNISETSWVDFWASDIPKTALEAENHTISTKLGVRQGEVGGMGGQIWPKWAKNCEQIDFLKSVQNCLLKVGKQV